MRKLFSFIAAVLFAGSMMAEPIVINPADHDPIAPTSSTVGADIDITMSEIGIAYKGSLNAATETTPADFRVFGNQNFTVSAASNISKIVIAGKANKAGWAPTVSAGTVTTGASYEGVTEKKTLEDPLVVIEGINAKSVTILCNKQLRVYMLEVTLEGGDEPAEPVVVYNWAKEEADQVGTTVLGNGGKTTISTVKIHENNDEYPAIKFEKGYKVAEGHYMAIYPAEGAFKAGDSIVFEAVINNSGARTEKYAMVDFYAADQTTRLFRGDTVVNGQTMADDPIVESFKLAADQDSILIGRYGTTNMFILALKVVRSEAQEEKLTFDFKLENNILTITPSNDDPWAGWALPTAVITEEFGGSIEALVEVAKDMMEPTQGKVSLDITTLDPEDFPAGTECTFVVWGLVEGAVTTIDSYEFVIPAPAQPITCAEVVGLEKDTEVTMKDVTVTYVNGKNVWIKDETGALLLYLPANATWKQGDVLSNLAGKVAIYNNKIYEVIPSADQVAAVVVTEGEAPLPEKLFSVTEADLSKYALVNVTFEADAAFAQGTASNITIKVGEQEIVLRNNFKNGYEFGANKEYDITVLVTYYQGALQLYFVSAVQVGGEPTVDYFLAGSMNGWQEAAGKAEYKLAAKDGEYVGEFTFAVDDAFKVIGVVGETITWFPEGMGNDYKITEAGDYTIRFKPEGGVEGWYEGFFLVEKKEAPKTISCADVYELAKNDEVALNDVVVTYSNGANVWIKDETASLLIYLPQGYTNRFQAGDVLTGVAGKVDIYQTLVYEVKPADAAQADAIVITAGEAPAPEEITALEATDVNKYIVLKGVEAEGSFVEGTTSNLTIAGITVRSQFKNAFTFEAGKKYNVYGVVSAYQGNPQVYFITAEESKKEALDNTGAEVKVEKFFRNGQLIIRKNGVEYNAQGAIVR